jgi:hypothetical protein
LPGPAGALPAGAAFASVSAMCVVESSRIVAKPKISRWSGNAEVLRNREASSQKVTAQPLPSHRSKKMIAILSE